ncbi:MAG: phosphoglycerate kinase, partial [Parcubacteria group bacterium RIFCSPHIGHO2_02_FULL_48_10b]
VAVVKFLPSYAGLLLEQEIRNLSAVMRRPRKPLVVISGGAKVLTKIGLIRNFLKSADLFLVGGAMANTFLKAAGEDIGDSLWEKASLAEAKRLLRTGKIVIPVDTAMKGGQILDIGKRTRKLFAQRLTGAKTVIWNGPLGYIEDDRFARGTRYVIRCVAASQAFSVVGGGETVELIEKMGFTKKFGFVSTGGGAMLEFLSGRKLPGIEALNSSIVR